MPIVCLDPGHGGRDPGALGPTTQEKNNNLMLAFKVGKILQSCGVKVFYTRTTDTDFCPYGFTLDEDLRQRVIVAKGFNPKIFVSLHNNSFYLPAFGVETNVFKFGGTDEALGRAIQKELIQATVMIDRGVKTARHYVIRKFDGTLTDAALVEYGFIHTEEDLIQRNMDVAAKAIAKGILSHLVISIEEEEKGFMDLILVGRGPDERAAGYLSDYLQAPVAYLDATKETDIDAAQNVYVVGGNQKPVDRAILLSGGDRYATCARVLDFIAKGGK